MILNWIYNKLAQKRDKERHNVIKLEWQKAELERQLENLKRQQAQKESEKQENR